MCLHSFSPARFTASAAFTSACSGRTLFSATVRARQLLAVPSVGHAQFEQQALPTAASQLSLKLQQSVCVFA